MKINPIEITGYIASILVFSTFYMKTMIPLRMVGLCSNIAFIAYAWLGALYPVLILHLLLLPLNLLRFFQLRKLIEDVRAASEASFSLDWLTPYATKKSLNKGDVIFRRGDLADSMYVIVQGEVRIQETGIILKKGDIIGEIGLFSPLNERTATLICESDSETLTVTKAKIMELYYQNPNIGYHLTQLIVGRLLENQYSLSR
jgi:CRP/FNR family cyclic AMP-dependent transcriptional regulator